MELLLAFLPSLLIGAMAACIMLANADIERFEAGIIRIETLSYQDGYRAGLAEANRDHFTIYEYIDALNYGSWRKTNLPIVINDAFRISGLDENSRDEVDRFLAGFGTNSPGDPQGDRFFGWEHK